jgi:hypothetical protein
MRQLRYLLPSALLFLATAVTAAAPELNQGHPQRYVVQPGDTLWDIAGYYLRDPWRWPDLWEKNPEIDNPDLIFPGDVLYLSFVNGQPRLSRERGHGGLREVKLSQQVRRDTVTRPIPTIPIDAIQQFLVRPRVMSRQELEAAPRVVAFVEEHIAGGAGDPIYVSTLEDDYTRKFDVVRIGEAFKDPDTGENLGHEAIYIGDAELLRPGDPAKLLLTASAREVLANDRLLEDPEEEALENFQPRPAPPFMEGKIIALLNGLNQIGQHSVVVVNKGIDDGLEAGQVMKIMQRSTPPRTMSNSGLFRSRPELPLEEAGLLMVFRPFERVSYALVMYATRALHLGDSVRSPKD